MRSTGNQMPGAPIKKLNDAHLADSFERLAVARSDAQSWCFWGPTDHRASQLSDLAQRLKSLC